MAARRQTNWPPMLPLNSKAMETNGEDQRLQSVSRTIGRIATVPSGRAWSEWRATREEAIQDALPWN